MFCAQLRQGFLVANLKYSVLPADHPAVILAVRLPSVTIAFRCGQVQGQAVADGRLAALRARTGRRGAGSHSGRSPIVRRTTMAGPGLPACAGGGLSRGCAWPSGGIARHHGHCRAPGREGGGWRCPGVAPRPCSQRPVPG